MSNFNFSPEFSTDVRAEFDRRSGFMQSKDSEWNYRKYAYFYIESLPSSVDLSSTDSNYLSVFSLLPEGGLRIGTNPPDGYLKSFHSNEDDIRTLKPVLSSATISAQGGGDIYDAYISEVNVDFVVYTLEDLELVQNELFSLGAKVKVAFGWLGEVSRGGKPGIVDGELIVNIYNFGFSMSSDGSFNCNIKGLTEGVFSGAESISGVIKLNETEKRALGKNASNPASLPQALLAKAYTAHGIRNGKVDRSIVRKGYMWCLREELGGIPYYLIDIKDTENGGDSSRVFPYISFGDLVKFISENINDNSQQFTFMEGELSKIPTPKNAIETLGSADPRKFILPGKFANYGSVADGSDATKIEAQIGSDYDIRNILVCIFTISEFYDKLSSRKNEKTIPPSMIKLLKSISDDMFRLTGGLVDVRVVPEQDDDSDSNTKFVNRYNIFNNTKVQQNEVPKRSYEFTVLNNTSIVKDISIDTDFDVDTMLMMSIGRVKNGEFTTRPLQKLYPKLSPLEAEIRENRSSFDKLREYFSGGVGDENTKLTIYENGIDNSKAQTIADAMRKQLVGDESDGTFISLPFYIKLGLTIDGVNGIGFLQPITVDRLPENYKRAGVKFLITGIEHTFDGQGGWDTKLDTAMKVGL